MIFFVHDELKTNKLMDKSKYIFTLWTFKGEKYVMMAVRGILVKVVSS